VLAVRLLFYSLVLADSVFPLTCGLVQTCMCILAREATACASSYVILDVGYSQFELARTIWVVPVFLVYLGSHAVLLKKVADDMKDLSNDVNVDCCNIKVIMSNPWTALMLPLFRVCSGVLSSSARVQLHWVCTMML